MRGSKAICTAGMARVSMLQSSLQAGPGCFLPLAAEYYAQDLARCSAVCHPVAPKMLGEVPPFGTVSCSDLEGEPLTAGRWRSRASSVEYNCYVTAGCLQRRSDTSG